MITRTIKPEEIGRKWYIVDAKGKTLGRLSTEVARRLRGKHKPEYTPNMDVGDYIVVINAAQVKVTGNKEKDKLYYRHSGYPGGIKSINLAKLREKNPTLIIEHAVKGMLPKGPLGRQMFKKLKVYKDDKHLHTAQQPEVLEF